MEKQNCHSENFTSPKFTEKQTLLTANITFLIYTIGTLLLAMAFRIYQYRQLKGKITLQTTFNAGGDMSISSLASTIVSQWTWAASLLQSTTVGTQFGLSGSYWYGSGACIQIILFSIVCMEMRIKAPGSRTFLQIIQARFDKKTHILYCIFGLITNAIVAAMLLVGGIASINYSFENVSSEYALLLFILAMSLFVFMGALGGLFYVSYFTTLGILLVIIIMFIRIFYTGQTSTMGVGCMEMIYNRYSCIFNPNNFGNSYKTFISLDGLMFGIINIIGNFGTVFVDQSYWQLNSTTSPKKSSIAFIIAGSIWFFIPFVFGTTMSVAYTYLNSFDRNSDILTSDQISSGLVAPAVSGIISGSFGNFLVNMIVIFAVTTTGGGEILAVTSIIINDILSVYIKPFKPDLLHKDSLMCILCEKLRGKVGDNKCHCVSVTQCKICDQDDINMKQGTISKRDCNMHGKYRDYEDYLNTFKNFVMILVTVIMLIIALFLYNINLSLNWLYLFMGILVGPAVIPITLSLFWARINSFSMFISLLFGCIIGIISWILTSVFYYGGFDLEKSGKLVSMLVGNVFSIGTGGILVVVFTFLTTQPLNVDQIGEVWEKTRDIDSPLMPWTEIYAKEINIGPVSELKMTRPSLLEVQSELRTVKRVSWIVSIVLSVFLIVVWPIIMTVFGDFSLPVFKFWIIIGHIFVFVSFIYCLFGPIVETYYLTAWNWIKDKRDRVPIAVSNLNLRTFNINVSKSRVSLDYD